MLLAHIADHVKSKVQPLAGILLCAAITTVLLGLSTAHYEWLLVFVITTGFCVTGGQLTLNAFPFYLKRNAERDGDAGHLVANGANFIFGERRAFLISAAVNRSPTREQKRGILDRLTSWNSAVDDGP